VPICCRGRYNVELHLSFLRLQGQANDFKIQYSSVVRIFLLPKVNSMFHPPFSTYINVLVMPTLLIPSCSFLKLSSLKF